MISMFGKTVTALNSLKSHILAHEIPQVIAENFTGLSAVDTNVKMSSQSKSCYYEWRSLSHTKKKKDCLKPQIANMDLDNIRLQPRSSIASSSSFVVAVVDTHNQVIENTWFYSSIEFFMFGQRIATSSTNIQTLRFP